MTYTDLVIDGSDNTKITSAGNPFTALHVGNVINVTSGTGFTVQRAQVVSVAAGVATMDKAMGTTGSTGGNGKLGGAVASPATVVSLTVAGNKVYIKGTINVGTAILSNVAGTDNARIVWEGFATTPGDGGYATLLATGSLSGSPVMRWNQAYHIIKNLIVDGDDQAATGLRAQAAAIWFDNCHVLDCTTVGFHWNSSGVRGRAIRCLATGCGAGSTSEAGFLSDAADTLWFACSGRDNNSSGFYTSASAAALFCLSHDNGTHGFEVGTSSGGGMRLQNCDSIRNGDDGLHLDGVGPLDSTYVVNCLFALNGGYGVHSSANAAPDYSGNAEVSLAFQNNAYHINALGARNRLPAGLGDVTLTADPFMDAAGDDFALNLAIGGGLLCRGAGMPGGFGLRSSEVSVGALDIGAVVLAGVGAGTAYGQGWARELWRELTNERDEDVAPDAVVDLYLQRGAEALNDAIRYHRTTDASAFTLIAGQQEYDVPADFIEAEWISWNGKDLEKGDIERWRQKADEWRVESAGPPRMWAVYANKLVVRPTPNAAAVATASTLTMRYVSTPGDVATFGFAQLPNHYMRLAIYYGAALWAAAYPESQRSVLLEKALTERFTAEGTAAARDYAARTLEGVKS